jgi:RNA polymerase sigma-70 factor (ECF subfamily)
LRRYLWASDFLSAAANEKGGRRKRCNVSPRVSSLADDTGGEELPDDAKIELFYGHHQDFVWRNARRLGCADEWVDDAVQEVFLVAARRLSELQPDSNVRGWLFAIVVRVAQRMQRDRGRYRARLQRYSETRLGDHSASPEASSGAAHTLRQLLGRLDEPKRAVVILIELEGMTSSEVGRALGIPQGTVDSRLRAARQQLAVWIEELRLTEVKEGTQPGRASASSKKC